MVKKLFARLIYGWRRLGLFIAGTLNLILLMIVYVLMVVPIGFIWKLIGNDPMRRKKTNVDSYFIEVESTKPTNWERMF